jgi:nucleoside-diphosphate-sugar epimerase
VQGAVSRRRVLVIGGTGFLGRRIVDQFLAHGDHVSVVSRGMRSARMGDIEHIAVDRHDVAAFQSVLRERSFDMVVDNIAFDADDVHATVTALRDRVGHYVLTSSAAVYANLQVRHPLHESEADLSARLPDDAPDPFHPRLKHAYGNGKRAAEQAVEDSGVAWTTLRPPVIVAADDRTERIWWLVQRILDERGPVVVPDWGPGRLFQVAWADDVARAVVSVSGNSEAFGHAYNVAQAEIFTAATWVTAFAAALGRPGSYVRIPEAALEAAGLPGYSMPIAGRPLGHVLLDCGAIRRDIGFEPSPEATWLGQTARDCAANPPPRPSTGYERRAAELGACDKSATSARGPWTSGNTSDFTTTGTTCDG